MARFSEVGARRAWLPHLRELSRFEEDGSPSLAAKLRIDSGTVERQRRSPIK